MTSIFQPGDPVRVEWAPSERIDGQVAAVYEHGCDVICAARGCFYYVNADIERRCV